MTEMLAEEDVSCADYIVIDSDNCSAQYKPGLHFYHLQEISNQYSTPVIRMHGIPGHGKGEVDHVGGTAKVTVRKMAVSGMSFYNASGIVNALDNRYAESSSVNYRIKEITVEQLEKERKEAKSIIVSPTEGSSSFRAMVFKPGSEAFKASTRLCICEDCKVEYGLCSTFSEYSMVYVKYNVPYLRSDRSKPELEIVEHEDEGDEDIENENWDFLTPGSIVAVANQEGSHDSVWFIKVTDNNCEANEQICDSYNNHIIPGIRFLKGKFLERSYTGKDYTMFQISKLETFFYRETIIYPFVTLYEMKNGLKLMNTDYTDILNYAQINGFKTL